MAELRDPVSRLARLLAGICCTVMCVALAAMAASVFLQVVLRSAFDTSWLPLDDLVVYGFTVVVFTGTALVFRADAHLATPVLLDALPPGGRAAALWLVDAACAAFLLLLLIVGTRYAADAMGQFSPLLRVRVGYVYAAIPLCGFAGLVFILDRRLASRSAAEEPEA